jgi:methionyl-tRNA synthetase
LYETRDFGKALREIMAFADEVNLRFDGAAPWKLVKEGKADEAAAVCSECLEMFKVMTACLKPVLPQLAAQAEAFLNAPPVGLDQRRPAAGRWPQGGQLPTPDAARGCKAVGRLV